MKFKINRDHFVEGLQKVQNIAGNRSSMPILNNVLLNADDGCVSLTTTNLDLGIRCQIKAEVNKSGSITLPVRKLSTIVRSLPNIEVELETGSNHQAKITSGGSMFRIMGISQEEFPPLPHAEEEKELIISQRDLANMIKSVEYAQSSDENRYILNGIYFSFDQGKLNLVATDGRRLGLINQELPLNKDKNFSTTFILPAKTASELERLLGEGEYVKIKPTQRQVVFEIDVDEEAQNNGLISSIFLVSKIVEGNYPNYNQVIPKETTHRVKIERELLLECLSRASLVTSEKSNAVRLHMGKNLLKITSSTPELGESNESMAINFDHDATVELAFNPQFLIEPLKALTKDDVFFEFKDELSPGVLKTLDSFLCVVMPLRLS